MSCVPSFPYLSIQTYTVEDSQETAASPLSHLPGVDSIIPRMNDPPNPPKRKTQT